MFRLGIKIALLFQVESNKNRTFFLLLEIAHSSVEKASILGGVKMRSVPIDENNQLRGDALEKCIREDLEAGLIPFYVSHFSPI